jgi:plasmid stabilization system protein ParE
MAYRVVLADSAKTDADHLWNWVVSQAPRKGPAWFERLIDALYSLETLPQRCPKAREADTAKRPIRCLLFGKRHGVYRILYEIDEKRRTVWILHIRHGALKDLPSSELANIPREN